MAASMYGDQLKRMELHLRLMRAVGGMPMEKAHDIMRKWFKWERTKRFSRRGTM